METPKYKFAYADPGNYRTYYRLHNRVLYCIQNEGSWGKDNFVFNQCSRDGEPAWPVKFPEETEFDKLIYPDSIEGKK